MSKHGRFEREKPKTSKKKIGLIIGVVVLVLILAIVIGVVVVYNSVLNQINKVDVPTIVYTKPVYDLTDVQETESTADATVDETTVATEPPHVASSEDYINFLVVGQAGRPGEDSRMADTMILCTINTYEKSLTMTSVLRDTLVLNPWDGNTKITSVYHMGSYKVNGDMNEKIAGSMQAINLTLNRNFGIEVDHNFEIDMDMFITVIDLLGGITVNLTEAEADYLNKDDMWVSYDVEPGWFHLDGSGALCYARMRKAEGDSDSDIKRTARQRHLIERVIDRLKQLTPSRLEGIVKEVLPMVSTSMSNAEITETLVTMLKILPELQIKTGGTCPASNDVLTGSMWGEMKDIYGDGMLHSCVLFDRNKNIKYFRELTEGEVAQ